MKGMQVALLILGPPLIFGISSFVKYDLEQKVREIGVELHQGGLLYILPLTILHEEYFIECFLFYFISASTLVLTMYAYTRDFYDAPIPKLLKRAGLDDWGEMCLAVGLSNFIIGLILSVVFNVILKY